MFDSAYNAARRRPVTVACEVDAVSSSAATVAVALATLRACGYVLLRNALSAAHVQTLLDGYAALPESALLTAGVRDGRSEQLLPFAPPFNAPSLLHDGVWNRVAEEYLGAAALDLDAVTAVLAPHGSPRQALHRDVLADAASVLSVHIPLVALPSGGGTLALQPTSHLGASDDCDDASEAPREVPIEPGSAIVYDARTCHLGTANHAVLGTRPVLYLLLRRRGVGGGGLGGRPGDGNRGGPSGLGGDGHATTGYEPRELLLRYGRAGLDTVRSYRADFRARRAALLGVNSSSPSSAAAWLLGDDPDGEGEAHNFLFPFLRTSPSERDL